MYRSAVWLRTILIVSDKIRGRAPCERQCFSCGSRRYEHMQAVRINAMTLRPTHESLAQIMPFIGPEHSNQGMQEEDKVPTWQFFEFACGTESVQLVGRRLGPWHCLLGVLPTSFADLSQLHDRKVSYKSASGKLPASWFAHAAFAHLPQGKLQACAMGPDTAC